MLLLVVDLIRVWAGKSFSVGLPRQTPYQWRFHGIRGFLAWGLDTGTSISTVRASALPLLSVAAVTLGFGAPWIGAAYAIGFGAALLRNVTMSTYRHGQYDVDHLVEKARLMGPIRLVIAPTAVFVLMFAATSLFGNTRSV